MFHDIPPAMAARMEELERLDARDRVDGTDHWRRLRQIPPSTGRLLALLAAAAPAGRYVEIGTSAGYSTLWIALACRTLGRQVTTYELLDEKADLATETFALAGVGDVVELVRGDARGHLAALTGVSFCFLDAEKAIYGECYEAAVPALVSGGLLVADNATNHEAVLAPMLDRALSDERVDATILRVDRGLLLCRRR